MITENQTILLLRIVNEVLSNTQTESSFYKSNFTSEREIIDPIIPYLKD